MDKKTEEKNLLKNSVKCIIAVLVVIGIGYLIITFSKKGLEPAPNTTIDYNSLNVGGVGRISTQRLFVSGLRLCLPVVLCEGSCYGGFR